MTKPLTEQMAELRDWRDRMAPSYGPQAERTQYFGMARERRDRWRDVDRLLATVEAQAEVIERTVEWLVAINYGFDFSTDEPLPEPLRRPLAEAWWRRDQVPDAFPDVTVDDYLDLLTEEARWGEVVAPRGEST